VKSHPYLLVRDALAELFVEASERDPGADRRLDALVRWAKEGKAGPELQGIQAEDGTPLFLPDGRLDPRFGALEGYVRDRAERFDAACGSIRRGRGETDSVGRARAAWNAGLFFEVHEILEAAWLVDRSPDRDALQGLIMAAAAFYHLGRENSGGAAGLSREAARRLRGASEAFPVEVEPLATELERLSAGIERGEIRSARDLPSIPTLRIRRR
jgi:hypothetical protein